LVILGNPKTRPLTQPIAPVESSGSHDVAACEDKAQFGNGLRVAVEASNKPLSLLMGYLTVMKVTYNYAI